MTLSSLSSYSTQCIIVYFRGQAIKAGREVASSFSWPCFAPAHNQCTRRLGSKHAPCSHDWAAAMGGGGARPRSIVSCVRGSGSAAITMGPRILAWKRNAPPASEVREIGGFAQLPI